MVCQRNRNGFPLDRPQPHVRDRVECGRPGGRGALLLVAFALRGAPTAPAPAAPARGLPSVGHRRARRGTGPEFVVERTRLIGALLRPMVRAWTRGRPK